MYFVQVGRGAGQQFPPAGVWAQEAVCVMVARMVTKCGAMWRNCYTDTEVTPLNHEPLIISSPFKVSLVPWSVFIAPLILVKCELIKVWKVVLTDGPDKSPLNTDSN